MSADTCENCGQPYRVYAPWYEPPENHYMQCRRCSRTVYLWGPEDEEEVL